MIIYFSDAASSNIHIDTSYVGKLLVYSDSDNLVVNFGSEIFICLGSKGIQGTLNDISEDGSELIIDDNKYNISNVKIEYFAVIK